MILLIDTVLLRRRSSSGYFHSTSTCKRYRMRGCLLAIPSPRPPDHHGSSSSSSSSLLLLLFNERICSYHAYLHMAARKHPHQDIACTPFPRRLANSDVGAWSLRCTGDECLNVLIVELSARAFCVSALQLTHMCDGIVRREQQRQK